MIKRYCDWCGAEIEKEYYIIEVTGKQHSHKTIPAYYDISPKNLELCEKCYKNFKNFLNKKDS